MECKECGAPAEVEATAVLVGADFDGSEALFSINRIRCAAGHWYDEIGEVVK